MQKILFLCVRSVSHSVLSDMKVIEQEKPGNSNQSFDKYMSRGRDSDTDSDGFTVIGSK